MKKSEWGFTVAEVAGALGVSRQYLYALIRDGKLHPRLVPVHEYRFTEADIEELRQRREART